MWDGRCSAYMNRMEKEIYDYMEAREAKMGRSSLWWLPTTRFSSLGLSRQ